jgi:hemoglobin
VAIRRCWSHARQGADDDLGRGFVVCFSQAADDAALPKDPEFRAVLEEYMRSADEVLSDAPKDAAVEADLPVPHWGWNGLE